MSLSLELEEPSGRVARAKLNRPLVTQSRWVGLKPITDKKWHPVNSQPSFDLVLVDAKTLQKKSNKVSWKLIEEEWDYFWTSRGGDWAYRIEYYEVGTVASGILIYLLFDSQIT